MKRSRDAGDSGQATLELALVLPLLVLLFLSAVQVAAVARQQIMVDELARVAARASSVEPTEEAAAEALRDLAPDEVMNRLIVSLSGSRRAGDIVKVTVVYQAPTSTPLVGVFVGDVAMSATVAVRVE